MQQYETGQTMNPTLPTYNLILAGAVPSPAWPPMILMLLSLTTRVNGTKRRSSGSSSWLSRRGSASRRRL